MRVNTIFIIGLIFSGCLSRDMNLNNKNNFIVKYYRQSLVYNDEWYKYKPKYFYYDEASSDFNISKPFVCSGVEDRVSEVFFKNKKALENNIPFKVLTYCLRVEGEDKIYPNAIREYDEEGKIVRIKFLMGDKDEYIYKYTKNEKIKTYIDAKSGRTRTMKFVYDKDKNLMKILKYKNHKLVSIYRFDEKDKNILRGYDITGKLTEDFISLYEDPSD